MPRAAYLRFLIGLLVGLPLRVALLANATRFLPTRFINLPNRDYWLAPEREAQTLAYLCDPVVVAAVVDFACGRAQGVPEILPDLPMPAPLS